LEKKKIKDGFKDDNGKWHFFTVPNILTIFRILLIPLFVYLFMKDYDIEAFAILVLSGVTDVVDGFIARHYNMVSAVGKALDPIADKLTQVAMLSCLMTKFVSMWVPFLLMIFKEFFSGISALFAIKYTGEVHGADWHGKLTTFSLYAMMALHIIWPTIPSVLSNVLVGCCVGLMIISLFLYNVKNITMAKDGKKKEEISK